jgi:PAS domain-containing protein
MNRTTEPAQPEKTMQEREALCRAIFNISRDAILLVDRSGMIGEVSDSAEIMTGRKRRHCRECGSPIYSSRLCGK